jgi:hypothetical protein
MLWHFGIGDQTAAEMPTNTPPSAGSGIDSDYEKPRDFFWGYF